MRSGLLIVGLFGLACSSGDAGASTYADVSGSFAGPVSGTSQGVALTMTLSLTVVQNGGSISGTDASIGTVGGSAFSGTGTFTGNVVSGNNPSVNVTTSTPGCPSLHSTYSGAYDSANRRLTMAGPFYIIDTNCNILLTYQLTLILTK